MFGCFSRAMGYSAFAAGRCLSDYIGSSSPSSMVGSFLDRKCTVKAVELTVGMVLNKVPVSELALEAMGTNRQDAFQWGCTNLRSNFHGLVTPVFEVALNMLRTSVDYQLSAIAPDMSSVDSKVQAYDLSQEFD